MKRMPGIMAVALLSSGLVIGGGALPASAVTCDNVVTSGSSSVTIFTVLPNPCYRVQAKMLRYVGTSIQTILGPESNTASTASGTNGTNSGNYVRIKASSSGSWSGWARAYY